MSAQKQKNHQKQPSTTSGGGDGAASGPGLGFESLACIDLNKMSQEELYSLSLCSASAFDLTDNEDLVTPTINTNHLSEMGSSDAGPAGIPSFFRHRVGRRSRRRPRSAGPKTDEADVAAENKLIVSALDKLKPAGGEGQSREIVVEDSYGEGQCREIIVVDSDSEDDRQRKGKRKIDVEDENVQGRNGNSACLALVAVEKEVEAEAERRRRRRKVKGKVLERNERQSEEMNNVIVVNGEEVDLKFLARVGDSAYEDELRRMTAGLSTEEELLEFLRDLRGPWTSYRERRKLVNAADILKVLPENWQLLIGLRPRVRPFVIGCLRFRSPEGVELGSCKHVAYYLRARYGNNVVHPLEGGGTTQNQTGHNVDEEPAPLALTNGPVDVSGIEELPYEEPAPLALTNGPVDVSGIDELPYVPVHFLIDCPACNVSFHSISAYEQHLGKYHWSTTRRLDFESITGEGSRPHIIVNTTNPDDLPSEASGTSGSVEQQLGPLRASLVDGNSYKATCYCCLKEFLHKVVDVEPLPDALGFMCPGCKEITSTGPVGSSCSKFCYR